MADSKRSMITENQIRDLFCGAPVVLYFSQALDGWMCQVKSCTLSVEVLKNLSESSLVRLITIRSYSSYGLLIILEKGAAEQNE